MTAEKKIKLSKKQAKKLYTAIELHCLKNEYSPYSFGYAAGVSHNYVYRLKDARSTSYNVMAIKKIVNALGSQHLEDVIDPKVKPQQKDKPVKIQPKNINGEVIDKPKPLTSADMFDALPVEDQDRVKRLVSLLYEKQIITEKLKRWLWEI